MGESLPIFRSTNTAEDDDPGRGGGGAGDWRLTLLSREEQMEAGGGSGGSARPSISLSPLVEPSLASTMVPRARTGSPHRGDVTGSSSKVMAPIPASGSEAPAMEVRSGQVRWASWLGQAQESQEEEEELGGDRETVRELIMRR